MEGIPKDEQERWMKRDLARREGGASQVEYIKRLEADEAHMRTQHQTMSEELGRLVEERNVQIGENQDICKRMQDETNIIMKEDKRYIADELAKEMHQLSDRRIEQENLRKQIKTETIRLDKDREEARKSRGVRDEYEKEINRQSTKYQESTKRVAELTEDRVNEEKALDKLRRQNHEEKKEMLREKELRQNELRELGKMKSEMEDYLQACQTQIDEERATEDVPKQHVSSTPRTVLKDYDPFEKVGAMNHVNGGKYNRRYTAPDIQSDPSKKVTIGRTETKERTPSPSHSYGSLHPFADDTVTGHGPPTLAAPVYNIHYSYGGQTTHDVGGGNRQGSNQNPGYTGGGSGGNSGGGSGGNSGGGSGGNSGGGSGGNSGGGSGGNPGGGSGPPDGNGSGSGTGPAKKEVRKLTKRASMTPGMTALYEADPCIQQLGIDCCSRAVDEVTDVMDWSQRQSDRLVWSVNAARKTVRTPKAFKGEDWKESYQDFCDDNNYHGWDKDSALGPLVRWLNEGPGRIAVDEWRQVYGDKGTYDELVTTAAYIFGTLVATDPWSEFQKRTQKPKETSKIYGLELQ